MSYRRGLADFKRQKASKIPKLRILVVTEGAKTERLYVSLFVKRLRAANVEVRIFGEQVGTDPLSVVQFAVSRFKADTGYDICFCLIDRDTHDEMRFNRALELAKRTAKQHPRRHFDVVVSYPCIEFWFLLHFCYSRSPFERVGNRSPGDMVCEALSAHLPGYDKVSVDQLLPLIERTDFAILNSRRAEQDALETNNLNPSTRMHEFVEKLLEQSN